MELSRFLIALCILPGLQALLIPPPASSSQPIELQPYPESPAQISSPPSETVTFTSWLPWSPETIRLDLKPFPVPSTPPSDDPYDRRPYSSSATPCASPQRVSFSFSRNFRMSVTNLRTTLFAASQPSFWKRKQYFVPSSSSTSPQNQHHHQHYRYRAPMENPLTIMLWFFLSLNALVLAWRMRQSRLRARRAEQLLAERLEVEKGCSCPVRVIVTDCDHQMDDKSGLVVKG